VGLEPPKSSKLVTFHINLPKRVYPLKQFLQNLAWGESPRYAPSRQILPLWLYKCGFAARKIAKIGNFWYIFPTKGYIPSSIFTKFGVGERLPSPQNHANFHLRGFKNVALRPPKSQKNSNFWYKFAPKKKSRGSIEKLEYRCTTRNLPLCNGTIIVLKITLLHSVSVITNFVIPKRDKKTNKKNITLFRLQPARDPRSPPYLAC